MSKASALKEMMLEAAERISGSSRQIRDQFDLVRGLMSGDVEEGKRIAGEDSWEGGKEVSEKIRGGSNSPMVNAAAEAYKWLTQLLF